MSIIPNFFKLKPDWASWFFDPSNKIFLLLEEFDKNCNQKDFENFYNSCYLISFNDTNLVFLKNGINLSNSLISDELYQIYKNIKKCGYFPTIDGKIERWVKQGVFILNYNNDIKSIVNEIIAKFYEKDNLIWVIDKSFDYDLLIPKNHKIFYFKDDMLYKNINKELEKMNKDEINW
jgi:hypothetical protein